MPRVEWTDTETFKRGGPTLTGIVDGAQAPSAADVAQMRTRLALCVATSRSWISLVLAMELGAVRGPFQKYFRSTSVADHLLACNTLRTIRNGLDAAQEVKIVPMSARHDGYVGGGRLGGKRRIHLSRADFLKNTFRHWAMVYLHEASHLYAGTEDHAYVDDMHRETPYDKDLTTKQALQNADSYTYFVYECAERRRPAAKKLAAAKTAAPRRPAAAAAAAAP